MKRFVSLILSVCFLFSINTVSYAANISSRKASNPVIQSMNDKYHVDFSGMSIDELNKFIDKMKDEVYTVTIQAFKTVNGKTYATPKAKIQCFNQARIKETSIKVKKGSLSFQWGKVGGASGYDVYISTKPKKGYKKVKSVGKNTTKLTIRKFKGKKINPKKTYYMYVETKKKNGSKVNKSGRLYYWNTKSKNFGYF